MREQTSRLPEQGVVYGCVDGVYLGTTLVELQREFDGSDLRGTINPSTSTLLENAG